jgi:hypothetical protein
VEELVALHQGGEFVLPLRKAAREFLPGRLLACLPTDAQFLTDQSEEGIAVFAEGRMPCEIILAQGALPALPGRGELACQLFGKGLHLGGFRRWLERLGQILSGPIS